MAPTLTDSSQSSSVQHWINRFIFVSSILEIIGELLHIVPLRMLKPVPMLLMITYIYREKWEKDPIVPKLITFGLIFSVVGDVFLMFAHLHAFMIGTCFFFVGHVLYCIAFTLGGTKVRDSSQKIKLITKIAVFGLFTTYFLNIYTLWDVMPDRVLFPLYGFVLCLMNVFSVQRYEKTNASSYKLIVLGAVLFAISDNMLGFLKFNKIYSDLGRAGVMLFYYGGQYLLMHGGIKHSSLQNSVNQQPVSSQNKKNGVQSKND